jgi:hypothetical protein
VARKHGTAPRPFIVKGALMDWYAEEILEIAWDSSKDTIPADGKKPARCDNEWVNRSRLKVDTLKFLMAKLHPRKYGDKLPEAVEEKFGTVADMMKTIGVLIDRFQAGLKRLVVSQK